MPHDLLSAMSIGSRLLKPTLATSIIATLFVMSFLNDIRNPVAAQTAPDKFALKYPERAIHIIVPFAPGGASDVLARVIGGKLAETFGQAVVIDNRPGAGGNIGAEAAKAAAPDGYTLLLVADAVRAPSLNYNIVEDFSPITLGLVTPMIVVTPLSLPVKTLQDFMTMAKDKPMFFGSGGVGSSTEIAGLLFSSMGQLKLEEVSYKSIPPVVPDLVAGRLEVAFLPAQLAQPLVSGGQLRALAVTSAMRSAAWPDLPTVAEAGIPGFEHNTWGGFMVPVGTPAPIIAKLNAEIIRIMQLADVRQKLTSQGSTLVGNSPEEFGKFLKEDVKKQHELVKRFGLKFN